MQSKVPPSSSCPPVTYASELPEGPSPAIVEVQTSYGPLLVLSEDQGCSSITRAYGDYSPLEMVIIESYITPDSVVLDVGANIGAFTVPLAQKVAKVYAFEPQLAVAHVLQLNTQQYPNVEIIRSAVGHQSGTAKYTPDTVHPGSVGMRLEGEVEIPVVTIDSLNLVPDFIKIDVEGMEIAVLAGAHETITKHRPIIFTEFSSDDRDQVIYVLTLMGYTSFLLNLPIYTPNNRAGCKTNYHPRMAHMMILGIPDLPKTSI